MVATSVSAERRPLDALRRDLETIRSRRNALLEPRHVVDKRGRANVRFGD